MTRHERDWVDLFEALTVGLVQGRDPRWVAAAALGPEPVEFADRSAAEDWTSAGVDPARLGDADQYDRTSVSMVPISGWTVVWADWGTVWTDEHIARELSRDGEFACYSWGTGAMHLVQVARDGEIVRSFDPWFRDDDAIGSVLPEERSIEWSHDTHVPGILLVEALTGLGPIDVAWRDRQDARVFGYEF